MQGLETGIRSAHGNVLRYTWEPDFRAEVRQQAAEADKIWLLAGAGYGTQQTFNGLVDFASITFPIDTDYVLGRPRLDLVPQPQDNVFDIAYLRFGEFAFYGADLAFGSHGVGNLGRGARVADEIVRLGPRSRLTQGRPPTLIIIDEINLQTGSGFRPNNPPVRIEGEWTQSDLYNALYGRSPLGLGRPDLHHADQMPGSPIHKVLPLDHRGNVGLHPNRRNQGVTNDMRRADREMHWWMRARERGLKMYTLT